VTQVAAQHNQYAKNSKGECYCKTSNII